MRPTAAKLGFLAFALAVNALLFVSVGFLNLGVTEVVAGPLPRRYHVVEAHRLKAKPRPRRPRARSPRRRPPPKERKPRVAAPAPGARAPRPEALSPLTALQAPEMGGVSVPVSPGLFEPGVIDARPYVPPVEPAKPAKPEKRIFSARDLDRPPRVAHRVNPDYPEWAAEMRIAGFVTLRFLVSPAGAPEQIRVVTWSGDEEFQEAARKAVRQWRFDPGTRKGRVVAFWCRVTIRFEPR